MEPATSAPMLAEAPITTTRRALNQVFRSTRVEISMPSSDSSVVSSRSGGS